MDWIDLLIFVRYLQDDILNVTYKKVSEKNLNFLIFSPFAFLYLINILSISKLLN